MADSRPVPSGPFDERPGGITQSTETTLVGDSMLIPMNPSRATRPSLAARQYSAHVYALPPRSPAPGDIESGIQEPETAHVVSRRASEHWPLEALVTVRPSQSQLEQERNQALRRPSLPHRGNSNFSVASGISCEEVVSPPSPILHTIEAHGPGTYRCVVKDVRQSTHSFDSTDTKDEVAAEVKLQLERLSTYEDKVASKERLEYLRKEYPLPAPKHGEKYNLIRYGFFSVYRRLFALVFLINAALICFAAVRAKQDPRSFTYGDATTAVAANLFVGVMMRHEHSVNFIFWAVTALPLWMPLAWRRQAAKVYSYGGIHSSCGVSASMWYILFAVLVVKNYNSGTDSEAQGLAVIVACMIFLFMILMAMSLPRIRKRYHDEWELSHRFGGWLAIGFIWAQTFLITFTTARTENRNAGVLLITTPAFWLLLIITGAIIYPWLRLRRRSFTVEPLSTHATRLHFHHDKVMPTCKGLKLSDSPLTENHAFASIPNVNGGKGYSVIIANNGDWTKRLIKNPPERLWVKGAPISGVMQLAFLFRRIVVVATGSGIGPCLSFFNAHPNWDVRIVWAARFPATSFGVSTVESVLAADKDALLIDTKKTGKDGLTETTFAVYKESEAEAVVVISNPVGTKEVVYALESRGVPAYGAIWDS